MWLWQSLRLPKPERAQDEDEEGLGGDRHDEGGDGRDASVDYRHTSRN